MNTDTGEEKIENGWRTARVTDALKLATKQLLSIDPFDDLNPMVTTVEITQHVQLWLYPIFPLKCSGSVLT